MAHLPISHPQHEQSHRFLCQKSFLGPLRILCQVVPVALHMPSHAHKLLQARDVVEDVLVMLHGPSLPTGLAATLPSMKAEVAGMVAYLVQQIDLLEDLGVVVLVRVVVQRIGLAQDLREMAVAEFEELEKECGLQDDLRLVQSDFVGMHVAEE